MIVQPSAISSQPSAEKGLSVPYMIINKLQETVVADSSLLSAESPKK